MTGFVAEEVAGDPPGNDQANEVAFGLLSFVNETVEGKQKSLCWMEKPACGGVWMVTWAVLVSLPQTPVEIKVTVYTPSWLYEWEGLLLVLCPPSPKYQMDPVECVDWLVNIASRPLTA